MHKSKLIGLLKGVKRKEWKQLKSFLLSRYKADTEIITLYNYIANYKNDFDHKKLDLDVTNAALFKDKSDKNFLNLMSKLYGDVLDYMAWTNVCQEPKELTLHQIQALNRRGLYGYANDLNESFQKKTTERTIDLWNEWYKLRAWHEIKFSVNLAKQGKEPQFFAVLMKHWSNLKNELNQYYRTDAINIEHLYEDDLSAKYFDKLKVDEDTSSDLVGLLQKLEIFQKKESDEEFDFLFDFLRKHNKELAPNIGVMILYLLIIKDIRKAKSGDFNYNRLFVLYNFGLESRYLFDRGKLNDSMFLLPVELACLDYIDIDPYEFIEKWSSYLNQDTKDAAILLARCTADIYIGDCEEAILKLTQYRFRRQRHRYSMRVLLLMAHFNEAPKGSEFLKSQLKNFQEFTKRHVSGLSPIHYKGSINFASILNRYLKGEAKKDLLDEVKTKEVIIRRIWLTKFLSEK